MCREGAFFGGALAASVVWLVITVIALNFGAEPDRETFQRGYAAGKANLPITAYGLDTEAMKKDKPHD